MFLKILKYSAIGITSIILVTAGIDAADHYGNMKESLVGRFVYGEEEGPCPTDMVYVPTDEGGFCIDKYESSPGNSCPNSEPGSQTETRDNLDSTGCSPESKAGARPWTNISQAQAITACAKAGKRLPTNEEWYQASLGTPDPESGWTSDDCQVSSNWPSQPGQTATGKNCQSSAGAFDMIGNVWEWVKGEVQDGYYEGKKLPGAGYIISVDINGMPVETIAGQPDPNYNEDYFWIKASGIRSMARGGYWSNKADAGLYAVYLVPPPTYVGSGVGFRCAK